MAPAYAVPRLLARNGLTLQDFDFYEIHEAFAAHRADHAGGVGGRRRSARERLGLDGAARRRSTAPSSTSTARRSPPVTRSPPPAAGSSPTLAKLLHEKRRPAAG